MKAVGKGNEEGEREIREHIVRTVGLHTCCQESSNIFPIIPPLCHLLSKKVTEHFAEEVLCFFLLFLPYPGQGQALD